MKSADVLAALRRRYPDIEGEWLFFTEAWHIDAYAVRCWTSGIGYRRVAIEVKVSRSDFRAELRNPKKRENALSVSHEFYFAVPHGLVRPDEVPEECGLIFVKDGRARVAKKAPLRTPRALKLSEAIYLMRLPGFRQGTLELRRAARLAESNSKNAWEHVSQMREELQRAQERLLAYASDHVTVGSLWCGRWQPRSWMPAVDGVEVYVEKIQRGHYVTARCVESGEVDSYLPVARLLTDFVPLDGRAISVLGAA